MSFELSVEDFMGMEFKPNMSYADYAIAVANVEYLKSMYEEEYDLVAEQDEALRIKKQEKTTRNIQSILSFASSSFPVKNLDHQEKPPAVLDFVIPKAKRSSLLNVHPRIVIKKAVENSQEEEKRVGVKVNFLGVLGTSERELPQNRAVIMHDEPEADKEEGTREEKKVKRDNTVGAENNNHQILPSTELPIEFKNRIIYLEGRVESAILVFEKKLYETDVRRAQGRLSIPMKQMRNRFLKPQEDEHLNSRNDEGHVSEIRVKLIEPSLDICDINLRKWNMNKDNGNTSSVYVLVTCWNNVVQRNSLKPGNLVQLWAFRKANSDELCLALVRVQD